MAFKGLLSITFSSQLMTGSMTFCLSNDEPLKSLPRLAASSATSKIGTPFPFSGARWAVPQRVWPSRWVGLWHVVISRILWADTIHLAKDFRVSPVQCPAPTKYIVTCGRTDRQTDRRIDRQTDRQTEVGFFREVTRSSLVLYKLYHIYFLSHHWEQFFSFDAAIFSHGLFNLSRGRPPSAWNSFCTTSWWLSSDKWHNMGWKEILPLLTTAVSQLWDLCIWRIWPHLTCLYLTLPLVSLVTRNQGHASLIFAQNKHIPFHFVWRGALSPTR